MGGKRVLIPLFEDEVAPRFDLATEVLLAEVTPGEASGVTAEKLRLPVPSVGGLCDLVLQRSVDVVICGGIEEEHHHYLRWKRVEVLDNVAGLAEGALKRFVQGSLRAGDILFLQEDGHAR